MTAIPPDNPEDWTDEEWLSWLVETDGELPPVDVSAPRRRPRSTSSGLLYAAMFGLHEAIYGAQEQVTIVQEADGQPDDPEGLEVHLDRDDPDESTVVLRPWLIDGDQD